jgi:hypothetical protein
MEYTSKFQQIWRGKTKDCDGNKNVNGEKPEKRKQMGTRKD